MDRKEVADLVMTTKLLPIMEAWLEGKTIQFSNWKMFDGWHDVTSESPAFNDPDVTWRIKPVPRKWWIAIYRDGRMGIDTSAVRDGTEVELVPVVESL